MARIMNKPCGCEEKQVVKTTCCNNTNIKGNPVKKLYTGTVIDNDFERGVALSSANTELLTFDQDFFKVLNIYLDECGGPYKVQGHTHITYTEEFKKFINNFIKGNYLKDIKFLDNFIETDVDDINQKPIVKNVSINKDYFANYLKDILKSEKFKELFTENPKENFEEKFKENLDTDMFKNFILKILSQDIFVNVFKDILRKEVFKNFFKEYFNEDMFKAYFTEYFNNLINNNRIDICRAITNCNSKFYIADKTVTRSYTVTCPTGQRPKVNPVQVTSPAFKAISTISQGDADNKALALANEWLNSNGQSTANNMNVCEVIPSNPVVPENPITPTVPVTNYESAKSASRYFNVTCDAGTPKVNPVKVVSPQMGVISQISQEDADRRALQLAEEWLDENGQNEANRLKECVVSVNDTSGNCIRISSDSTTSFNYTIDKNKTYNEVSIGKIKYNNACGGEITIPKKYIYNENGIEIFTKEVSIAGNSIVEVDLLLSGTYRGNENSIEGSKTINFIPIHYNIKINKPVTPPNTDPVTPPVNNTPAPPSTDHIPRTTGDIIKESSNRTNILLNSTDFNGKYVDEDGDSLEAIQIMGDMTKLKYNGRVLSGEELVIDNDLNNINIEYLAKDTDEASEEEYVFRVKTKGVWSSL